MEIRIIETKKEVAKKIVGIIENFYTSDKMDITTGLTQSGEVDYEFDVHGGDIVVPIYKTKDGWTLDNDGDPEAEEYWTDEIREGFVELFSEK